jgi:small conductance mechanosensitive channel
MALMLRTSGALSVHWARATTPWLRPWLRALLLSLAFGSVSNGGAQESRVAVRVDGRAVFRVGASDTVTAAQRALRIERRIAQILETPDAVRPARVIADPADSAVRVLTIANARITAVTPADAEDNLRSVDALAADWARALDEALVEASTRRGSRWTRFSAEVRASVTAAFGRLGESLIRIVPRVLAATLVLGLFWGIAAGVRRIMRAVGERLSLDLTVQSLLRQLVYYSIWTIGLLVTVDALGFQAQTVVTGLGLTGLALGFALKDIISNFVSGLLILALRPFQLSDQIVVGDTEGSVERIRLRATDIRTYDGRLVLVPNADLFTSRVTNNTASPIRRAAVPFHVGYGTDLRRALEVAHQAVRGASGVLEEPSPVVRVQDLREGDVQLEARFWTDSRRTDFVATQAAVRASLTEALREAGIALPNPEQRTVTIERTPDV